MESKNYNVVYVVDKYSNILTANSETLTKIGKFYFNRQTSQIKKKNLL